MKFKLVSKLSIILNLFGIIDHGYGHQILSLFFITGLCNINYFDSIHLELAKNLDILEHSKCKLFIRHGGLSSLHESIYHVPVAGIPFFGHQDWNMKQIEYHGIGRKLELSEINKETLKMMLNELLNNTGYTEQSSIHSKLFRGRQVSTLDDIEYILRHEGAPHLKSPVSDLNGLQYYCVDLILFFFMVVFVQLLLTVWCLCKACIEILGKDGNDGCSGTKEKPKND